MACLALLDVFIGILPLARSGDIPQDLLRDILIEASKYKTLHNQNPSEFLES